MSDELPPPPPGITLMSPQEFLDRRAAPAETPRADAVAIGEQNQFVPAEFARQLERERNAWEAKFNAECEKHDATTLRAMKAERELAEARANADDWMRRYGSTQGHPKSNPSATAPISGEISTAHVYRDACGDIRIAIRYTDDTEEDRPAPELDG